MLEYNDDKDHTQTHFVIGDATGRITQYGQCPRYMVDTQPVPDGHTLAIGWHEPGFHYVADGKIAARPQNPARLNDMKLVQLPIPSTVLINDTSYEVDDGELEMTFPQAGTYKITVLSWPCVSAHFTVTK